jgi:hypothetical protein
MLDGSASWYYFGGLSFFRWSAWFGACRVTASLCYSLSSNRDDSFQKTKASLPFCRANCARTVCACMCLFRFLSKNENNNGFGTIGLNSYSFDFKRVANIQFTVVFRIVFSGCFGLDWMRNLHNEHHLAAKNGTFTAFQDERSSLL